MNNASVNKKEALLLNYTIIHISGFLELWELFSFMNLNSIVIKRAAGGKFS